MKALRMLSCPLKTIIKRVGTQLYSDAPLFKPKKVLILSKLSKYEYEKRRHPELTERELEKLIRNRGSDYNLFLYHHYVHKGIENTVNSMFNAAGIETRVVSRYNYTYANIDWADVVVATGGDGTYLLAATRILDNKKPLIGFNSDPLRSKGHLCLPLKYSVDVKEAIDKLLNGRFKWTFRKRIRVTLTGENIFDSPVELHNQEVQHPENRYLDLDLQLRNVKPPVSLATGKLQTRTLPVLALNEVFIGECVSARVSYLELSVEGKSQIKQKCSGLIASTGTGSTSWTYSISRLTEQNLEEILTIIKEETELPIKDTDPSFIKKITDKFNQKLIINSEEPFMVYTIRDMLPSLSSEKCCIKPRGFAKSIDVKSRCFDASLVIDGGVSYRFNDGTFATLEICDEDSLRTVTLLDDPS